MRTATVGWDHWFFTIIRIDTNQGISGYGEVRDFASKSFALMLKSRLLGENPCNVDRLFRKTKQFGHHARQGQERRQQGRAGVRQPQLDGESPHLAEVAAQGRAVDLEGPGRRLGAERRAGDGAGLHPTAHLLADGPGVGAGGRRVRHDRRTIDRQRDP